MKAKEIKKMFAKGAKDYSKNIKKSGYMSYKNNALWITKKLNKKNKILDLGCGTGLSSVEFFKKKYEVTGIDISKHMLEIAKKFPFKKLICQDLEKKIKVKSNYFDAVVLSGVL